MASSAASGGEPEAGGNDDKSAGFWWLDAARYAVAAVVTVLIIAVVVRAIMVVFRADSMTLSVLGGSVFTKRVPSSPPALSFSFNLRARNPSGRVRMYYFNITTYLFDKNTPPATATPFPDCLIPFNLSNMTLAQMEFVDTMWQGNNVKRDPEVIKLDAFDALMTRGQIKEVTMRVDGWLVTEMKSGYNTTARNVIYYCRQLVVGEYGGASMKTDQELGCTTS